MHISLSLYARNRFYCDLGHRCYSESGKSVPCRFEDYLKIDFHDWMIIRIDLLAIQQ